MRMQLRHILIYSSNVASAEDAFQQYEKLFDWPRPIEHGQRMWNGQRENGEGSISSMLHTERYLDHSFTTYGVKETADGSNKLSIRQMYWLLSLSTMLGREF